MVSVVGDGVWVRVCLLVLYFVCFVSVMMRILCFMFFTVYVNDVFVFVVLCERVCSGVLSHIIGVFSLLFRQIIPAFAELKLGLNYTTFVSSSLQVNISDSMKTVQ